MRKVYLSLCGLVLFLSLIFIGSKGKNLINYPLKLNIQSNIQDKSNVTEVIPSTPLNNSTIPSNLELILIGKLPEGWNITFPSKNHGLIFKQEKQIGQIDIFGYYGGSYGIPNHSSVIRSEDVKSGLGNGILYLLERDMPAAANDPRVWNEYYAIIPIKEYRLAFNVRIKTNDLENDLFAIKNILLVLGNENKGI